MNLYFYLEKLRSLENYKNFIKDNPRTYLCSGFFVIDKSGKDEKQHFDFWVNSKMFTFKLEEGCRVEEVEMIDKRGPGNLVGSDFDFDEVEKMILDKMEKEGVKGKVQKIILSLQAKDGKDFLVGTVFISALGMLKVNIDLSEMKIIDFQKKSFFEMVNVLKRKK